MRKIIAEIGVSQDGFIEGPNGELDWLIFKEDTAYAMKFLKRFDTIFYGRLAYEKFGLPCQFEYECSDAERELNGIINQMRKYVFTRTFTHVPGNGMVLREHVRADVERIRDEIGKDIWLCGGANIIESLRQMDLIDEYVLSVQPVTLGAGKPLFQESPVQMGLMLIKSESLKSGIVKLSYRPKTRIIPRRFYDRSF